ncbi:MAG: tetratricopeptide repeat protein [Verrucomicrobiales bacterium]|nr:tetratricopeptide repeat protein [Verrucomicrobiales bacterium]
MRIPTGVLTFVFLLALVFTGSRGQEAEKEFDPFSEEAAEALRALQEEEKAENELRFLEPGQVQKLTKLAKPSLVTVRQLGRDGKSRGTGSGFIIDAKGLIVTNLHVIGEGRPIEIELSDGTVMSVEEIRAWDRRYDLAVIKVDPGARKLEPLSIGDSSKISQGQLIVGFGAPQGLEFSVVAGVVSAIRKLDPGFIGEGETPDYPMLQLAMPIEQGNSGGPILNLDGEVLGVVTLRHRVTENLGFAVLSSDLKAILDKPNPVLMSRWRTIGVLDKRQWTEVMGAEWSQRGGVITARQMGDGFGGRALCLSTREVPQEPYEVAVRVRLDDESGAAGLAFAADGGDKHYGFYPSGGKIRLTRFEGADVYSWSILEQLEAPSYLPGEWNELRVRVEKETITGWVNDEQLFSITDEGLRGGKVGLCKFRNTKADFRGFQVAKEIGVEKMSAEDRKRLSERIAQFLEEENVEDTLAELSHEGGKGRQLLLERADELEALADKLRTLESQVHRQVVINELTMALDRPETEIDLFEIGLQLARIDDVELDLDHYRRSFSRLVSDAREHLEKHALEAGAKQKVQALRDFLFEENGFHGSRTEYYHHANSYVNHVLDDREGLPISLSVIFIEMARRLQIEGVYGAPLPGKFMVGLDYEEEGKDRTVFVDVFDSGRLVSRSGAAREIWGLLGSAPGKEAFEAATAREIAVRMLRNLVDIEINHRRTPGGAADYIELLLAIEPNAAQERFQRALLRIQDDNMDGARADLDWLLEHRPPGIDYSRLEIFRGTLAPRE